MVGYTGLFESPGFGLFCELLGLKGVGSGGGLMGSLTSTLVGSTL